MKLDQFKSQLQQDGWAISNHTLENRGVDWYAWKSLDGVPDCECNQKPPSICIMPWRLHHGAIVLESCEVEVAGKAKGQWIRLEAYSVRIDEAIECLPRITEQLRAAWISVA